MTWQTVVNVFAVIGAIWLVASVVAVVICILLTRNDDALNRHSQIR